MSETFYCAVDTYRQTDPTDESGWGRTTRAFSRRHTGVVVMHAWQPPVSGEFPGWARAVPYLNRVGDILRQRFPPLLRSFRAAGLPVFHVTGLGSGSIDDRVSVPSDPTWEALREFRERAVFPGAGNLADADAGRRQLNIAPEAQPVGDEVVAETSAELHAQCQRHQINHLIYIGFALNWCLLMSPGGMIDMKRYGYLCSTVAEATVAVESRESTADDSEFRQALWRVAVEFGFVFRQADLIGALAA